MDFLFDTLFGLWVVSLIGTIVWIAISIPNWVTDFRRFLWKVHKIYKRKEVRKND